MVPDFAVPDLLLPTSAHAGLTPGLGQCRDGSLSPDSLEIPKSYLRPLSLLLTTTRSFFFRFYGKATQYILCELFTDYHS